MSSMLVARSELLWNAASGSTRPWPAAPTLQDLTPQCPQQKGRVHAGHSFVAQHRCTRGGSQMHRNPKKEELRESG